MTKSVYHRTIYAGFQFATPERLEQRIPRKKSRLYHQPLFGKA